MKKTSFLRTLLHSSFITTFYPTVKIWKPGFLVLSVFFVLKTGYPLNASEKTTENPPETETSDDYYIGVFVGSAQGQNQLVDIDGFANWGHPGSSVNYEETGPVGGVLIGKRVNINGVPLKIELDGTLGGVSASTDLLDPISLDETARADISWILTARAGLEKDLGPATVFINGGLAVARISNSVIDIDFGPNTPRHKDPDDSFSDGPTYDVGWVAGIGTEISLNNGWDLRVEGLYLDFGDEIYKVNRSGNNRCGRGGPYSPCSYKIRNKARMIRLAVIRRFSL